MPSVPDGLTQSKGGSYRVAIEVGFQQVHYPDNYTIRDMVERLMRLF